MDRDTPNRNGDSDSDSSDFEAAWDVERYGRAMRQRAGKVGRLERVGGVLSRSQEESESSGGEQGESLKLANNLCNATSQIDQVEESETQKKDLGKEAEEDEDDDDAAIVVDRKGIMTMNFDAGFCAGMRECKGAPAAEIKKEEKKDDEDKADIDIDNDINRKGIMTLNCEPVFWESMVGAQGTEGLGKLLERDREVGGGDGFGVGGDEDGDDVEEDDVEGDDVEEDDVEGGEDEEGELIDRRGISISQFL